jgi:hypothetical protein
LFYSFVKEPVLRPFLDGFIYLYSMKLYGAAFVLLIIVPKFAFSQASRDSTFSILINAGLGFTHANDPHINKWLAKYGYPTEPHVPESLHFELAAIPESSRMMYSVKLSTVISADNLTSFNVLGGAYYALVKRRSFMLFAGMGAGYHSDIIALNGGLPAEYQKLADSVKHQLSLNRDGLFLEPGIRAFWFPLTLHNVQVGLFGDLGYAMDFNSKWKLGYYNNTHGRYNHFSRIQKPSDQEKVNEHGFAYNVGLTVHLHLQ